READDLMTVEHSEWVVETGSQGIDETGHDIPVLTGQQMRQSALEGVEQEPDVFAGVEPMHGATPSVLGKCSGRARPRPLGGRGSAYWVVTVAHVVIGPERWGRSQMQNGRGASRPCHSPRSPMSLTDGILRARSRESLAAPRVLQPGQVYEVALDLG